MNVVKCDAPHCELTRPADGDFHGWVRVVVAEWGGDVEFDCCGWDHVVDLARGRLKQAGVL